MKAILLKVSDAYKLFKTDSFTATHMTLFFTRLVRIVHSTVMGFLRQISEDDDPSAGTSFDTPDDFLDALMQCPDEEQHMRLGSIMLGALGGSQSLVLAKAATEDVMFAVLKTENDLKVLVLKKSDTISGLPPAKIVGHEYNQESILKPCSVAQLAEIIEECDTRPDPLLLLFLAATSYWMPALKGALLNALDGADTKKTSTTYGGTASGLSAGVGLFLPVAAALPPLMATPLVGADISAIKMFFTAYNSEQSRKDRRWRVDKVQQNLKEVIEDPNWTVGVLE